MAKQQVSANASRPWTPALDMRLKFLLLSGLRKTTISLILSRDAADIEARRVELQIDSSGNGGVDPLWHLDVALGSKLMGELTGEVPKHFKPLKVCKALNEDNSPASISRRFSEMLLTHYGELEVRDVLADARHFCDANGLDFADEDEAAYSHYIEEAAEFRALNSPSAEAHVSA